MSNDKMKLSLPKFSIFRSKKKEQSAEETPRSTSDVTRSSSTSSLPAPAQSAHSVSETTLAENGTSSQDLWQKTGKNALLIILGSLEGISDTIPLAGAGVKAAASSLRGFIERIEETRENKQNFQNLAERIGRLNANIQYRESMGQKGDANSCREALKNKLIELQRLVEDASKQNRLQEFFNSSDDKASLGKYMNSLSALVGDLTNEDTAKILTIVSGQIQAKPPVTSASARPGGTHLKRLWTELVISRDWDEITCTIESDRWTGGTYTSSSKFDQVTYQIQVAFRCIKWTIRTLDSKWYPGIHSGYFDLPDGFPFKPPKLYFATPTFSSNLNIAGVPSIDLLWDAWSPARKLKDIMDVVAFMLTVDPAHRADYSDHLPNIPLNFHTLNTCVHGYLDRPEGEEAFCRAANFFARAYARPGGEEGGADLITNPTVEAYELELPRMAITELLEFAKVHLSGPEGFTIDGSPFESIKPGKSLLSELYEEERRWAEILAPKYGILFNPPPKKKIEEMLADFASGKIGGEEH